MAAAPEQLISFVRECLAQGLSRTEVSRELAAAGWSPREVSLALDAFAESSLPEPVPRKRVSSSPRDAFLHLVSIVALYNAAFAVGAVLFVLIDRWLPLPLDATAFWKGGLRWAVATLVVSLPILLVVHRAIARDVASNPGSRLSPIYRLLAYLTLLITALVMAGDLVCVLINFLQGDATVRFLLKALVVFTVAGAIYLWYAGDLRREESLTGTAGRALPPAPGWRPWLARGGFAAAVACLAAALALIDSPWQARRLRLDADRVMHLVSIQQAIENHYERRGTLPESLAALRSDPGTFVGDLEDPVSAEAYGYRTTGPTTYELTATFDMPSTARREQLPWLNDGFFEHGAGPKTFSITVPTRDRTEPDPTP